MGRLLFIAICVMLLGSTPTFAQTLFTYGNDSVSVATFLQAYNKNNTAGDKSDKAMRDYLNLYIASRLKIKEAKARGYDTLPQLVSDLDNLRTQVMPGYLNDAQSVNKLVAEAFARSQKDIHVAHIFVSFTNKSGKADSLAARKKINEAYKKLKNKVSFAEVARQYSDDPSVQSNGGDMGYITVFTLPYEIENIVYATPVDKLSPVYTSKAGYHIFKNLGDRKAVGKIKAEQILLAFPPDADAATKKGIQKLADSLYNRLQKGDDFSSLAKTYSNDFISASVGGSLPDFGVGQFDPAFENIVFAMKDGTISKPFVTTYGYHIVKRLGHIPVAAKDDIKTQQDLKDKVEQSDRINTTKAVLAQKILKEAGFKKAAFNPSELWLLTDSVLDYKPTHTKVSLTPKTPLFTIGTRRLQVSDWISYAQTNRYKPDGSGLKPYTQLWDEFIQTSALDYYKDHLETYNEGFRKQIAEFKEGNLFFEIMQRQVWGPAQTDTAALLTYYQQHKNKYQWSQSAAAVIFYANDMATAQQLSAEIKKTRADWRALAARVSEKVASDSNRFELSQLPNPEGAVLKAGAITAPLLNKTDNTASFAYVFKMYPQPAQRSFAEAKALVINDYQSALEEKWVNELKAKYPVKVNEKALETLLAKR